MTQRPDSSPKSDSVSAVGQPPNPETSEEIATIPFCHRAARPPKGNNPEPTHLPLLRPSITRPFLHLVTTLSQTPNWLLPVIPAKDGVVTRSVSRMGQTRGVHGQDDTRWGSYRWLYRLLTLDLPTSDPGGLAIPPLCRPGVFPSLRLSRALSSRPWQLASTHRILKSIESICSLKPAILALTSCASSRDTIAIALPRHSRNRLNESPPLPPHQAHPDTLNSTRNRPTPTREASPKAPHHDPRRNPLPDGQLPPPHLPIHRHRPRHPSPQALPQVPTDSWARQASKGEEGEGQGEGEAEEEGRARGRGRGRGGG